MQARNAKDFLRMLDPRDGSFGIEHLKSSERDTLKNYICRSCLGLPRNRREEFRKLVGATVSQAMPFMVRFYKQYPPIYDEHIVKSGVLYVPYKLRNLGITQMKEYLKSKTISEYILKCGAPNSGYKNAAKMLREKVGMSGSGDKFDKYVGQKIYAKIRNKLPKKKGYFASEADPDLLFAPHFEEYIYYVDGAVWKALGLDPKYYAKDFCSVWKSNSARYNATGIGKLLYDLAKENKIDLSVNQTISLMSIESQGIKLEVKLSVTADSDGSAPIGIGNESVEYGTPFGLKAKWSKEGKLAVEKSMEIKDYKFEAGISVGWPESTIYVGIEYTPGKSIGPSVGLACLLTVDNIKSSFPQPVSDDCKQKAEESFDFDTILEYAKAALAELGTMGSSAAGALAAMLALIPFAVA